MTNLPRLECTPKAVENRLYSWKKKNIGSSTPSINNPSTTNPSTPSKPTAKKPATPKAPRTPKSAGKKRQPEKEKMVEEDDDDEEMLQDSPSKKRGASSGAGSDGEGTKKVKMEVLEDGEGIGGFEV